MQGIKQKLGETPPSFNKALELFEEASLLYIKIVKIFGLISQLIIMK